MRLWDDLIYFFYPPLCLHCDTLIGDKSKILCTHCFSQIEMINSKERCRYCFDSEIKEGARACSFCQQSTPPWSRAAAVWDDEGPAATLMSAIKERKQSYLVKGMAAMMASQFFEQNWPFPDMIVPVPITLTHWIQRGFNQSYFLAKKLGKILNRPVVRVLKQTGELPIILQKKNRVEDKTVLLVGDVMRKGGILRSSAEALIEGCPREIYVLTGCRAIQ